MHLERATASLESVRALLRNGRHRLRGASRPPARRASGPRREGLATDGVRRPPARPSAPRPRDRRRWTTRPTATFEAYEEPAPVEVTRSTHRARSPLPPRVRPGHPSRHRRVVRPSRPRLRAGARRSSAPPLSATKTARSCYDTAARAAAARPTPPRPSASCPSATTRPARVCRPPPHDLRRAPPNGDREERRRRGDGARRRLSSPATWSGAAQVELLAPLTAHAEGGGRGRGCAARGLAALMLIGAHISSAGGIDKAIDRAVELDADSVQVFTQSPRTWRPTNHDPASFERFREKRAGGRDRRRPLPRALPLQPRGAGRRRLREVRRRAAQHDGGRLRDRRGRRRLPRRLASRQRLRGGPRARAARAWSRCSSSAPTRRGS